MGNILVLRFRQGVIWMPVLSAVLASSVLAGDTVSRQLSPGAIATAGPARPLQRWGPDLIRRRLTEDTEMQRQDKLHRSALAAVVKKIKPALVFLQQAAGKGQKKDDPSPSVLGILIDPQGTVVTNYSLVKGWQKCAAVLNDGRRLPAKVLLSDPKLDLAVIKVEDTRPLPHVEIGDSDKVQVGDTVLALSCPWTTRVEESLTVTAGIISGIKMGDSVFVVDTATGPECAPGPLLSKDGKFLGLVIRRERMAVNRAIPGSRMRKRLEKVGRKKSSQSNEKSGLLIP